MPQGRWTWQAVVVVVVAVAMAGVRMAAAEPPPPSTAELQRRVEELERQNAELLRRLDRVEQRQQETASSTPPAPPPPEPATPDATPVIAASVDEEEVLAAEQEEEILGGAGLGIGTRYGDIRASFQLFGDVGFAYDNPDVPDGSNSNFAIGEVDLFSTAQLGEHFQALTEVVIHADSDNGVDFTLQRLWGAWALNDAFYAKLGREHSPVSYWNRRYHHGKYLWLAASQPFLARFEGGGGPLPSHHVGLELGGRVETGLGGLQYVGLVANGRGRKPTEVTNVTDHNDDKAFDVGFLFWPAAVPGLKLGANFWIDEIPAVSGDGTHGDAVRDRSEDAPATSGRQRAIREHIETLYAAYDSSRIEAIGEFAFVNHDDRSSGRTFHHRTGYFQLGYKLGAFTPYTRFDGRDMERGDPFFAPSGVDLDGWEQLFGIRYDFASSAAVKFETGFGRIEKLSVADRADRESFTRLALQLSWVF